MQSFRSMARANQEEVQTFMSITGLPESVAVVKLQEHNDSLNEALNDHFNEGDRNRVSDRAAPPDDFMDIDDTVRAQPQDPPLSLLAAARDSLTPYSLIDESFTRRYLDEVSNFANHAPFVSHPREVGEIPIEVKDGTGVASGNGHGPVIDNITGRDHNHGPSIGTSADGPAISTAHMAELNPSEFSSHVGNVQPSAPFYDNSLEVNDVEEEMIRAAIEASKRDIEGSHSVPSESGEPGIQQTQSYLEDPELAHAVSLSLKTAEQEKASREWGSGSSKVVAADKTEVECGKEPSSNGRRLEKGGSSAQVDLEEVELPLIRHRSRRVPSRAVHPLQETGDSPPSPGGREADNPPQNNGRAFPTDVWGGISSEEHDAAVMLEAAMFGGIPEESEYNFSYAPHRFMRAQGRYPRPTPHPPSPNLESQRLIREQQDDEFHAALQADQEKELKAKAEAETQRVQEEAARIAALEEERRKQEEAHRKMEEQQEFERQLAAKEASLPQEPSSSDENAVNLLVRMPDGSRRGRRFLKSDKLQSLFDFIDIGRAVKLGTYRLVRPYPRRAFSDSEGSMTLSDLGLTSKQEALFLESL